MTRPALTRAMIPRWRSLLFVPASAPQAMLDKVHTRGADAVIVDLEDAVAESAKTEARARVRGVVRNLAQRGVNVLVRINAGPRAAEADLKAAFSSDVRAIVVPKVENLAHLRALSRLTANLETKHRLARSSVGLVAMIESPLALARIADIAALPRVAGLALGSEDLSTALGVRPSPANLTLPCQLLALTAAAHGIAAIGLPISLADYRDLDGYRAGARTAREMGLTGALCIHPAQVPVLNEAFSVSNEERAEAERALAAWAEAVAKGRGVAALDGRMIDAPVVQRARMLLAE